MATQPGMVRIALVIGLLGAVGPFAIDMYLPALPEVAADLGASAAGDAVHADAPSSLAFGVSQLVYGPLSDQFGRKPPLYVGLGDLPARHPRLRAGADDRRADRGAASCRGSGAATVMVVPRAIIRDLHTGPEATRLMAMVMLVISISPMLAPLAGQRGDAARRLAAGSSACWRSSALAQPRADRLPAARDAGARAAGWR